VFEASDSIIVGAEDDEHVIGVLENHRWKTVSNGVVEHAIELDHALQNIRDDEEEVGR
jgi:hypothetical protein